MMLFVPLAALCDFIWIHWFWGWQELNPSYTLHKHNWSGASGISFFLFTTSSPADRVFWHPHLKRRSVGGTGVTACSVEKLQTVMWCCIRNANRRRCLKKYCSDTRNVGLGRLLAHEHMTALHSKPPSAFFLHRAFFVVLHFIAWHQVNTAFTVPIANILFTNIDNINTWPTAAHGQKY